MAAPKENSLFPPSPHYIPGYTGFVPQYNYRFGETYGKTTYRLLTDPGVGKSPRPLLAPLHKPKFVEDFSGTERGVQGYLPGRPGYFPYERPGAATRVPEPVLGPKPPLPGPWPAEEELAMTHVDPEPQHHPGDYVPRTRVPQEYPRGVFRYPASEGREWRLPAITPARGEPVKIEDMTLPEVAETAAVEQDNWLPKLDVPDVIQQKVIPGYTGFIPRFTWVNGVTYVQGVKEAMDEFDRQQFLLRNPAGSLGRRFPRTYWPGNSIYTSAGLIPFYTGFVPQLRHTYALTFGNSTRKAYEKNKRDELVHCEKCFNGACTAINVTWKQEEETQQHRQRNSE